MSTLATIVGLMLRRVCVVCSKEFERDRFRFPVDRTTCGILCRNILIARTRKKRDVTKEKNPHWKGGFFITNGYMYLLHSEYHPRKAFGNYVKRATLVLEQKIGRYLLPNELAHHINEDRIDDRPENLQLMTTSEHQRYHSLKLVHIRDSNGKLLRTIYVR